MTACLGKSCLIQVSVLTFCERLSICACTSDPFVFSGK